MKKKMNFILGYTYKSTADVQLREHTQRAANCIPPAEGALNLAFGNFEKNGDIYTTQNLLRITV